MPDHLIAKAGTLVCVDSGEYSDSQVHGFFVVLRDFAPLAELAEYVAAHPEQPAQREDFFERDEFLAGLLAKGLLLEIAYGTLFLSVYHCVSGVAFIPPYAGNDSAVD